MYLVHRLYSNCIPLFIVPYIFEVLFCLYMCTCSWYSNCIHLLMCQCFKIKEFKPCINRTKLTTMSLVETYTSYANIVQDSNTSW